MALDMKKAFMAYLEHRQAGGTDELHFDLYAQDIDEWKFLQELIPGIIVTSAGGALPYQAEGFLDDYPFYFRSEWGSSSVNIAKPAGTPFLHTGDVLWTGKCTTTVDGLRLTPQEFVVELFKCMQELKVAPFLWAFKCRKPVFGGGPSWTYTMSDELDQVEGWGMTPEEGYACTAKPNSYLEEKGFSAGAQQALWLSRAVDPTPINRDERVWPQELPEFAKLSRHL
jgi:hypothetical protein